MAANLKIVSVLLLSIFVIGLVSTSDIDLNHVFEKCEEETGVDTEMIEKFNATRPIETDNEKIKCYLKCVFQETGWMTPDGKLQEGTYDTDKEIEQYKPMVANCLSTKGDNACETAFLFHKCVMEEKEGK